jgi:ankyrin repeat protein
MNKKLQLTILTLCSALVFGSHKKDTPQSFQDAVKDAISKNNLFRLNKLINSNLNTPDKSGMCMIHVATQLDREDLVERLIDHKADVNPPSPDGASPLHIAAANSSGSNGIITKLIMAGANLEARNHGGSKPIHLACEAGNVRNLRALILGRADINASCNEGVTPLHIAARWQKNGCLKLLLENGAEHSATTTRLTTPLHIAAKEADDVATSILLDAGAEINALTIDGWSPLHIAANFDPTESEGKTKQLSSIYNLLLQKGADHKAAISLDGHKLTTLQLGVLQDNLQFVARLLHHRPISNEEINGALKIARAQDTPNDRLIKYLQAKLEQPVVLSLEELQELPPLLAVSAGGAAPVSFGAVVGGESGNESDCSSPGSIDGWSLVSKKKP